MTKTTRHFDYLISLSGFGVIILVWQLASTMNLVDSAIFPGPFAVVSKSFAEIPIDRMLQHIGISLLRAFFGFSLACCLGISIGILTGWYSRLGGILRTPIELIRPIPPLAWIPIAIMWLGLGEASKLLIIFIGSFFPVYTNTYKSIMDIEPGLLKAAQVLGLRGTKLIVRVVIPNSLPDIATGMRIGWSYSFACMIAAELLAADSGLGYMIMEARGFGQIEVIIFGIVLIGLLNLITDMIMQDIVIQRTVLKWQPQKR